MKLSEQTIKLLENFSTINESILIKKGNRIRTISVMKNIFAEAEVQEEFPRDFAIYELKQFLNGLSLHDDPDLNFENDSYLLIKEGKRLVKYYFADPEIIIAPPEKEICLNKKDVCFQVEHSQLVKLMKAASVYQLPDLTVSGEDGNIRLLVRDKKNSSSTEYSILVGETSEEFTLNYKIENMKMVPGSYDVVISSDLLSEFKSSKFDLKYYIALESDSTFG